MKSVRRIAIAAAAALIGGCMTVGYEFPVDGITQMRIGATTQAQAKEMFGEPWSVGWEDGLRTWTYGKYRYSLLSPAQRKDLVLRFDRGGILRSYSYNTTEPGSN